MTTKEREQLSAIVLDNSVANVLYTLAEICREQGDAETFDATKNRWLTIAENIEKATHAICFY